jgi:hypothetical protein
VGRRRAARRSFSLLPARSPGTFALTKTNRSRSVSLSLPGLELRGRHPKAKSWRARARQSRTVVLISTARQVSLVPPDIFRSILPVKRASDGERAEVSPACALAGVIGQS